MADVSIRASLDGFDALKAALNEVNKSLDDLSKIKGFNPVLATEAFNEMKKRILEGANEFNLSQKAIDELMKTAKFGMTEATDGVALFERSLTQLALRYVAPLAIAHQLLSVWKESVAVAREAELQNIRLNTVLQSTGMVAGFTGDQLNKMASGMQEAFAIDSDKVKQAMTVLLTFTNIQGDMFTKTLRLGADFSRLYGGDMASAVRMFGRAFEDPERGVTMLRRANIVLSEEQIKLVKNLADTGDRLGAMAALLDMVQSKMNNVAEAIGQSGVSAVDRFKNAWSDMLKELSKTPTDPKGEGGELFGVGANVMKFATEQMTKFREMQTNLWLIYYGVLANASFASEETKLDAAKKFEALRKAIGIKSAEELAEEQRTIEEGKNKKFDEDTKRYWKDWTDLQVKQIQSRKALGLATAQDEANLMKFASEQEGLSETERLAFLAKWIQAKKEGQKFNVAEIDAIQQLNDLASKGNQARLSSELALGTLSRERYEELKTTEELLKNERDQSLIEQRLALTEELGTRSQAQQLERSTLQVARERLQQEREQIKARGDTAVETARRAALAAELKSFGEVADIRAKEVAQGEAAVISFRDAQKEKTDGLEREISLLSKTKAQREIIIALDKLEVEYAKALGGLKFVTVEQYQRQFDLITAAYEKSKSEIPKLIQANQDAVNEVTEFWKQAARNMQDAMSNLFFDIMQGKLSDLVGSFKQAIDRMVANFLAAQASTALFGKNFGQPNEPLGGLVGKGLSWLGSSLGFGGPSFPTNAAGQVIADASGMAFASGGSFTVGGSGGVDSQPVSFRATPGEKVSIETPGQQRDRPAIHFNGPLVAVYAKDVQSFNKSKGQLGAEMYSLASNFARRFS